MQLQRCAVLSGAGALGAGVVGLAAAAGLIVALSQADVERAQHVARGTEAERARFHSRYIVTIGDATVPQIEIVTPFRRVVLVTEAHLRKGDWLFAQSARSAEEAVGRSRDLLSLAARVRFNPLNTFISVPPYELAIAGSSGALVPLDTRTTPEFSPPFKGAAGKGTALLGASLEADVPASRVGAGSLSVGVTLDGKEVVRAAVDLGQLE